MAYFHLIPEEIITTFPRYQGSGSQGYITNFLGIKTSIAYHANLPHQSGIVEEYPLPPLPGNFHATTLEWAGVLRAVLDAVDRGQTTLTVVELGAGWAPWLVVALYAARFKGITKVNLIGVEGSKTHVPYMASHFTENGLNPQEHTLLHGVVGAEDGIAAFPLLGDPVKDWGASAIYTPAQKPSLWHRLHSIATINGMRKKPAVQPAQIEYVPCFSIATLLRQHAMADLIHFDIQGAEEEVIQSARQVLKEKVRRIVIGTHNRAIEQHLVNELVTQGWVLEAEETCSFLQEGTKMWVYQDGCQVWRNSSF